jgi:predicted transcriptional regulator of viral defense system
MGKEKYKKDIEALFKKSPIVSYSSISRIIKSKKKVRGYVKRAINYLIKQGKIKRITKGYYTNLDNTSLAVFCFKPAYLGLQDALSFHNLWEQETIPVIITSRNIRTGIRNILGSNVLIKKLNKRYLFGIEYYQEDNSALPYSDIEKTFIDMVYFKQPLDKETIKEFKKKIDKKKLKDYLRNYPKIFQKIVLRVLG